jgi:hypothetical protein
VKHIILLWPCGLSLSPGQLQHMTVVGDYCDNTSCCKHSNCTLVSAVALNICRIGRGCQVSMHQHAQHASNLRHPVRMVIDWLRAVFRPAC